MREKESTDDPPGKTTLKSYASRVFQESSVGVVSSAAQTTSTGRKVFKILVLIVCLTGFLYQSGKYLSVVFEYPTSVDIDVQRPDTYTIPAYTFCNNNRINRRLFCEKFPNRCEVTSQTFCDKYPSYCGGNETLKPKKEYYYMHHTLNAEEAIDLNVKVDEFEKIGSSEEPKTGPYLRIKDWEQTYPCYSQNDRVNNSLLPLTSKSNNIIRLPIDVFSFEIKTDEMFLPGNRAGLLFAVHSPFEAVNPFETGVFFKSGRTYMVYVSMDEEVLEKRPYDTDCINYTEMWEKNGRSGPRSQDMCKHNCMADLSLQCYGCIIPIFLYPRPEKYCELNTLANLSGNCPENADEIEAQCDITCRDDCRHTKFRFTVQERFKGYYDKEGNMKKGIENLINVEIYLDGDEVIVYQHTPKYMIVEVFSCIGGFIGMWLGMSLLDIADIVEGLFRIFRFSYKKR